MIYFNIKKNIYDIIYFYGIRKIKLSKRCFPQFVIIGAQKGGTTSLFNYLLSNKRIKRPLKKEVHYFSEHYKKGNDWYKMHFPIIRDQSITFEASTSYIFDPHAAKRMHTLLPDVKIIVLLRDPIDRAFSHYYHEVKNSREKSKTFEKAIELEEKRTKKSFEKMINDPNYYDENVHIFSYLKKGIYVEQLQRWYDHFDRQNILIIDSGNFFKQPERELEKIAFFLNIENRFDFKPLVYNKSNIAKIMNQDTHSYLKKFYAPYNEELFRLIGEEFNWK